MSQSISRNRTTGAEVVETCVGGGVTGSAGVVLGHTAAHAAVHAGVISTAHVTAGTFLGATCTTACLPFAVAGGALLGGGYLLHKALEKWG